MSLNEKSINLPLFFKSLKHSVNPEDVEQAIIVTSKLSEIELSEILIFENLKICFNICLYLFDSIIVI